jgi:WD40 repeat protein
LTSTQSNPTAEIKVKMDQIRKIKAHAGDVYALELLIDDDQRRTNFMLSGGDYSLKLWNTEVLLHFFNAKTGISLQTFSGHSGYVACVRVKGKRVFSGSWDTSVRSWNLEVIQLTIL